MSQNTPAKPIPPYRRAFTVVELLVIGPNFQKENWPPILSRRATNTLVTLFIECQMLRAWTWMSCIDGTEILLLYTR